MRDYPRGSTCLNNNYTAHTSTEIYFKDTLVAARADDGNWYPTFGGNLSPAMTNHLRVCGNTSGKVDGWEMAYRMNR